MDEHVTPCETAAEQVPVEKKKGSYSLLIRVTALLLVIAILLNLTSMDFSLLRYQGTDQMAAAQYLMESTSYLGENRLQRLKSLLTGLDSFSINMQAADIAIGKTDYARAAKFLNKCIPQSEDSAEKAELYNRLGCVYMLAGDAELACEAFDSSIEMNPQESVPYLLRAQLRYQKEDAVGAVQDAATYLKLGGDDADMLTTAASICELGGDLEHAEEAISGKIPLAKDDTEKARAYADRGRIRYLMEQETEAAADIDRARQLNVGVLTGVHYAIVALCEYNAGDFEKARQDFLKAARLSEEGNAEYYEQAIMCGYLSQDYAFIKQTLEEARKEEMMTPSALLIEGILMFSEECYEEAEKAITESIDSGTVAVGSYYYRGLSRLALNKFEEAAVDFTLAQDWEQDQISCIFNRGICYYALGKDDLAAADFEHVVSNSMDEALVASAEELLAVMALEE